MMIPILRLQDYKSPEEQDKIFNEYAKNVIFLWNDVKSYLKHKEGEHKWQNLRYDCVKNLFDTFFISNNFDVRFLMQNFDFHKPILWYGGYYEKSYKFIKNFPFLRHRTYNRIDRLSIFGSKIDFAKLFSKYEWLPKTVFTREEAINGAVGFPLIAKCTTGHSGLGIKKFDTPQELASAPPTFKIPSKSDDGSMVEKQYDLFCQFVDFDMEFRVFLFRDKVISVNHRVDRIENNVDIRSKDEKTKMNFEYVVLDKNKIPEWFYEQVQSIVADIHPVSNSDVWSLDVCLEKRTNKLWVFECNNQTGLDALKACLVYVNLYEDYFDKELPQEFKDILTVRYIIPMLKDLYKDCAVEIESSPWKIPYKEIISRKIKWNFFE